MGYENSKETIEKLLESARREFAEKGYMKASLRNICKEAGVTTGALYFFFKDKDDLFAGVVGRALQEVKSTIESHLLEELDLVKKYNFEDQTDLQDDYEAAVSIVKTLFKYKQECEILITKSQGSSFENILDEMVKLLDDHYCDLFWRMKGYESKKKMTKEDKFVVHWMAHDQVDVFIHLLTHCKNEKEALKQLKDMFNYIIGGWFAVVKNSCL